MWFKMKVIACQLWCDLTGAHAVYVTNTLVGTIKVKVMRSRTLTTGAQVWQMRDRNNRWITCEPSGHFHDPDHDRAYDYDVWRWCYVCDQMRMAHTLMYG